MRLICLCIWAPWKQPLKNKSKGIFKLVMLSYPIIQWLEDPIFLTSQSSPVHKLMAPKCTSHLEDTMQTLVGQPPVACLPFPNTSINKASQYKNST